MKKGRDLYSPAVAKSNNCPSIMLLPIHVFFKLESERASERSMLSAEGLHFFFFFF